MTFMVKMAVLCVFVTLWLDTVQNEGNWCPECVRQILSHHEEHEVNEENTGNGLRRRREERN